MGLLSKQLFCALAQCLLGLMKNEEKKKVTLILQKMCSFMWSNWNRFKKNKPKPLAFVTVFYQKMHWCRSTYSRLTFLTSTILWSCELRTKTFSTFLELPCSGLCRMFLILRISEHIKILQSMIFTFVLQYCPVIIRCQAVFILQFCSLNMIQVCKIWNTIAWKYSSSL